MKNGMDGWSTGLMQIKRVRMASSTQVHIRVHLIFFKHGVGLAGRTAPAQNRAGTWSVLEILAANDDPVGVFGAS